MQHQFIPHSTNGHMYLLMKECNTRQMDATVLNTFVHATDAVVLDVCNMDHLSFDSCPLFMRCWFSLSEQGCQLISTPKPVILSITATQSACTHTYPLQHAPQLQVTSVLQCHKLWEMGNSHPLITASANQIGS